MTTHHIFPPPPYPSRICDHPSPPFGSKSSIVSPTLHCRRPDSHSYNAGRNEIHCPRGSVALGDRYIVTASLSDTPIKVADQSRAHNRNFLTRTFRWTLLEVCDNFNWEIVSEMLGNVLLVRSCRICQLGQPAGCAKIEGSCVA